MVSDRVQILDNERENEALVSGLNDVLAELGIDGIELRRMNYPFGFVHVVFIGCCRSIDICVSDHNGNLDNLDDILAHARQVLSRDFFCPGCCGNKLEKNWKK